MNIFDGAVFYCDAGARPNPGNVGLGSHGYFYNLTDKKDSQKLVENHVVTDRGYIPFNLVGDNVVVEPKLYLDFVRSEEEMGTNNKGEASTFKHILEKLLEYKLSKVCFLFDSEYVINGAKSWAKNWEAAGWVRQDGNPIVNCAEWKAIVSLLREHEARGVTIEYVWVKGHNDDLGNTKADFYSIIGINLSKDNIFKSEFTLSEAKNYWKNEVEKHPFLSFKRLYFNSNPEFNNTGNYFLADPGAADQYIGKRLPESGFAVIRLNDKVDVIEEIIAKQCEVSIGSNAIIMTKLDRVFSKDLYPYLKNYGKYAILPPNKNLNLNFLDKSSLTVEMNPVGLSMRAVETFNFLEEVLDRVISEEKNDFLEVTNYDITNKLFESVAKKDKTISILRKELTNQVKHIEVNLDVVSNGVEKNIIVPIVFGLDILPRNNLKKLETENPKVSLITWKESQNALRYAVVIKCDSGIGIWSNFFSDKIFF